MLVFDFPYHMVRTKYPDSSPKINFGRSWVFAASPEAPDQREFTLSMAGMTYYTNTAGEVDQNAWPGNNMRRLENFYIAHRTHLPFWYYHAGHGFLVCRFKEPLDIPYVLKNSQGVVEEFELRLIEIPGLQGFQYAEATPERGPSPLLPGMSTPNRSVVSIAAPTDFIVDGAVTYFSFLVTRLTALTTACSVNYTVAGTASHVDLAPGQVRTGIRTFDANEASVEITVGVNTSATNDPTKTLIVGLSAPFNCQIALFNAVTNIYTGNDLEPAFGEDLNETVLTEEGDYLITEAGEYIEWE
jgi:hypothetical protein